MPALRAPRPRRSALAAPALAATAVAAALLLPLSASHAQAWMQRVKKAAQSAAADEAARRSASAARRATDGAIDAATAAGKAAVTGSDSAGGAGSAAAAPKAASGAAPDRVPTRAPDAAPNAAPNAAPAPAASAAWANFDFTPGTRPLFVDDFSGDNVGDFPKRMKWKSGNFEIVEWQGARWVRATAFGRIDIPLPEVLPERFTLEFDVAAPPGWSQSVTFGPDARGASQPHIVFAPDRGGLDGRDAEGSPVRASSAPQAGGRRSYGKDAFPIRVQADGQHVKVYLGETRVVNVPQVDLGRDRRIAFGVSASTSAPVLIGNVRVMAGGRSLYDALAEKGRVATQGIYFATASDVLRPESAPTLKEIAAMLAAHPELRLTVEGHTDDVGSATTNQSLSARRAEAVRQALVAQHGVDAARLEARGFGATRPASPNATAEGRQANRRVELVKR